MLSRFYKHYSRTILCLLALSFPFVHWQASTIKSNNDIETWLPVESPVRAGYERFKRDFGVEELVFVGDRGMVKAKGKQAAARSPRGRMQIPIMGSAVMLARGLTSETR